jgi:acyl-CoA synthetase (AMP-forming)/AMP-acid ligase II
LRALKFPEQLVIVDELPRAPSGTVSKDVPRARAIATQPIRLCQED